MVPAVLVGFERQEECPWLVEGPRPVPILPRPVSGPIHAPQWVTAPGTRAVAFRNRCDFPIRVLYAASASGRLASLTGLLQPGESSGFVRVEDGFDQPGYVVCSYAAVPASRACRLPSSPG